MIVRTTTTGIEAPAHAEKSCTDRTPLKHDPSTGLHSVGDRLNISHRARTDLNDLRRSPELNGRIKALLNTTQLTKEQGDELLSQIREGYYQRPEILRTMAAMICSVLDVEP